MVQLGQHRRYLWSTLAVTALLIWLGVFTFVFFITYDDIPSVRTSLWISNKRPPAPQLHFGGSVDTAWLILVACLGLATPFLELITWIPVPDWVYFWQRPSPKPTSFDAQSAASVNMPAEDGDKAVRPPKTWYQKWVPSWILALSPAALLFLFIWQGVMWASLWLPYAYRYLDLSSLTVTPRIYGQFVKGANASFDVLVVHALGRTSGWPCCVAWAMAMIPATRSNSWLVALNMRIEEANLFHRLFGWNAFFWTSFHGIFTHAAWLAVSVDAWRDELYTDNGWYSGKWPRYIATPGWFIMCAFAITCIAPVRKHCYNLFRISHLSIWIMLPLMIMHEYYIYLWMSYGFMLYAADLAERWVVNSCLVPAVLTKTTDTGNWQFMIRMTSRHMVPKPSWAGKHVYLRVSRVSWWETHPFTVCAVDGDIITLQSGGNGNWTRKVYALAEAAGPEGLDLSVCVEGPYGNDLAGQCAEADTVVLIAGGMGITPIAGMLQKLMDAFAASAAGRLTRVHFIWVVRQAAMAKIIPFNLLERAAVTAGFSVKICVTSGQPGDGNGADVMSPKEFNKDARPDHVAFTPAVATSAPERSPFMTFLPRFLVRLTIVWCATGFITAGYLIARQIGYISRTGLSTGTVYTQHGLEVGRIYNASVLANYQMSANYSSKVPWPKGQPTYDSLRNSFTEQVTFGAVTTCYSCSKTGTNPASFPYGSGPYGCCTTAIPLWNCYVQNTFPFLFCTLLSVGVALLCKWFLGKDWMLRSASASSRDNDNQQCPQSITALELAPQRASSSTTPSSSSDPGGDKGGAGKMHLPDLGQYEPGGGAIASGLPMVSGRPNLADELTAIAATCAGGKMAVYCCGPPSLSAAARRAFYNDAWLHGCKATFRNFFQSSGGI